MKKFYVIRSKKESDRLDGIIKANNIEEAHEEVKENLSSSLLEGEIFLIFENLEPLSFERDGRVIVPSDKRVATIGRL
ncbi:hypothetical protein GLV94_16655 [Virgibacillus halodenitrificans]|uniref:hypothetical protein n=1 Tax=Virgibacillus halodenitrificans TaxID=1482 RepID=UPI00136A9B72|nr:hypothetical protein [Virgibacillus halodenitrificans]MYL47278.1 hypothetical protein [Virgibacillus halodenitrificans]